jgi:hypothetical protein
MILLGTRLTPSCKDFIYLFQGRGSENKRGGKAPSLKSLPPRIRLYYKPILPFLRGKFEGADVPSKIIPPPLLQRRGGYRG